MDSVTHSSTLLAGSSFAFRAFVTSTTLWVGWRLWRFTISPWLDQSAPKALPYALPFFGHVRGMAVNAARVFRDGCRYFKNSRDPWSLAVLGEETYIVTRPSDVLTVYRDTVRLDPDQVVKDVLRQFGVTQANVNKLFDRHGTLKHTMDHFHELFKVQMHPGDGLKTLQKTLLDNIDASLRWDRISGSMLLASSSTSKRVSLWKWCGYVLVNSATLAFFGESIFSVAPTLLEDFFVFDDEAWKLPYKYPKFAAKALYASKARCEAAFAAYVALPQQRRSDASWIVSESQRVYEDMGVVDPTQCGAALFSLYRVTNSNAYRLCFWSMAHLLHNLDLLEAIKAEMGPAVNGNSIDMPYLLDKCPHLASFYEEILRTTNDPIGIRFVAEKVTIGGKVLQPGRNLLMPYRLMHYDPAVFGADVAEFNSTRFLKNGNLYRSSSWKPFGGGTMYCPGRFLAKREVYMFLALILFRFDIKLAASAEGGKANEMPILDETIPAGGILPPVPGSDVIVDVMAKAIN
ncbi:cytochrome P450 [Nemania sp. FL0031]|nr:cytochrome P450 [Nemania sp. FL0031]